jgi:hypothetical protein
VAFAGTALADGQLPSSKGTLYTVPALTVAYVKKLTLFNTNAATQTILVYLNTTGTSRVWRRFVLAQNESADVLGEGDSAILQAGDLIEASSTNASAVDYYIAGVLEA